MLSFLYLSSQLRQLDDLSFKHKKNKENQHTGHCYLNFSVHAFDFSIYFSGSVACSMMIKLEMQEDFKRLFECFPIWCSQKEVLPSPIKGFESPGRRHTPKMWTLANFIFLMLFWSLSFTAYYPFKSHSLLS